MRASIMLQPHNPNSMKENHNRTGDNRPKINELLRLDRANNDLMQLGHKLNSYTCEPCTQSMHEQIQSLRTRMEQLRNSNNELIAAVRQRKKSFEDVADVVKKQLREFNELQKGIFDYTRMAKAQH